MLAYITGSLDEELQRRNEYLVAENGILRSQLHGRIRLNNAERIRLAEIGKRLGRKALAEVAQIVSPETILAWHRRLVARKFDGTKGREGRGFQKSWGPWSSRLRKRIGPGATIEL